mmetsp:Transcript_158079/g.507124  ORF Transcript_158079/g.507124 Transcript_158079/m.507124 type:complete len:213 (-) Transcript_158079:1990-2628(-)
MGQGRWTCALRKSSLHLNVKSSSSRGWHSHLISGACTAWTGVEKAPAMSPNTAGGRDISNNARRSVHGWDGQKNNVMASSPFSGGLISRRPRLRTCFANLILKTSKEACAPTNCRRTKTLHCKGASTNATTLSHTKAVLRSGMGMLHRGPVQPSNKRQMHSFGRRQIPWPEQSSRSPQSGSTCMVFGWLAKSWQVRVPAFLPRTRVPTISRP